MKIQENFNSKLSPSTKIFYIHNLGCAKNQVDAEIIISTLKGSGWEKSDESEIADLIIVNTCGFIKPAKEESIETILSYRELYPDKKIIMAGCLSERYGESFKESMSEVDAFFGNKAPDRIAEVAEEVINGSRISCFPEKGDSFTKREELLSYPGSAYLKIAEGCNHCCSFCAIPVIRGNLRSRSIADIITEVNSLLTAGTIEINLIAQDLAVFGKDRGSKELPDLLKKILEIKGNFRIRLLYIHPDNFPFEILDICASDKRILPYFDLPFQHASKKILSRMGRKGNVDDYLKLISTIRTKLPEAIIRSTFLIGFPGEGKKEFSELLCFIKNAQIDWAGAFIFSREEDTKAFSYTGKVREQLFRAKYLKRKKKLEQIQERISESRMDKYVGKELMVLVEEEVRGESIFFGRAYLHAPEVDGAVIIHADNLKTGDYILCRITKRNGIDLEAVIQ